MGAEPPSSTPSISDIIPFGSRSPVYRNRYHKFLGRLGLAFTSETKMSLDRLCPNLHTYIHKNVYTVDSKKALDLSCKYQ